MNDQLHRVADDLRETWVVDWAAAGVDELQSFLSKHAAFLAFLDEHEEVYPPAPPSRPRAASPPAARGVHPYRRRVWRPLARSKKHVIPATRRIREAQLPRPRSSRTPAPPAAHRRDDRHLHLRDDRGRLRRARLERHDGGARLVARPARRARIHRPDSPQRARGLAHDHARHRALEDGDLASRGHGHRNGVLRDRGAHRPRRLEGGQRPRCAARPDDRRLPDAGPGQLAGRGDRVPPRDARPQARRRARGAGHLAAAQAREGAGGGLEARRDRRQAGSPNRAWAENYSALRPNSRSIALLGRAPSSDFAGSPFSNMISIGIETMPYFAARPCSSSMLTLAIFTLSACSSPILSSAGAMAWHGPHHSAQKSTMTGFSLCRTSCSKVLSFTATGIPLVLSRGLGVVLPVQT